MSVKLPLLSNDHRSNEQQGLEQMDQEYQQDDQFQQEKPTPIGSIQLSPNNSNDYQKSGQKSVMQYQSPQPLETLISLKKQSDGVLSTQLVYNKIEKNQSLKSADVENSRSKKQLGLELARKQLEEKQQNINNLKLSIADRKQQLKQIGDQVDKDLNKSMFKASKFSHSVNIRDIFSAPPKSGNGNINVLNEDLKRMRMNIKKVKTDIQQMQAHRLEPVNVCNQERGLQYQTKLKELESQIKLVEKQKEYLNEQLIRAGKDINFQEDRDRYAETQALKQSLAQLVNSQKEEKLKYYRLEKQDLFFMEKAKFLQEREQAFEAKRNRGVTVDSKEKARIQESIRQIVKNINEIIEQRNKTENERKNQLKALTIEASSIEAKNWELFNKLREIQSHLLHYYDSKNKKKEQTKLEKLEKSSVTKIDPFQVQPKPTPKIQREAKPLKQNDKNIGKAVSTQQALVQKKKTYEFGSFEKTDRFQTILSDQLNGNKNFAIKLTLYADKQFIFGIEAQYQSQSKDKLFGYKMVSKCLPSEFQKISLDVSYENSEVINFVHIGNDKDGRVKYLNIITSQGKQIKWGSTEDNFKTEQKNIRKYQYMNVKAKLMMVKQAEQKNVFCLSALGFSTIYLGAK